MSEQSKCDDRQDSLQCGKGQDVVCPVNAAELAKDGNKQIRFIDLFAGCGGLSEGFVQAGYSPVAHVEMDKAACFTLKTRCAFHWLLENKQPHVYSDYLLGKLSRSDLYAKVPNEVLDSVLDEEIGDDSLPRIFSKIDSLSHGEKVDLIVGGPPCQAYSLIGRAKDANGMKGDKRNYLFKYYAKFLEHYEPRFFVFENVLGLLSAKDDSGTRYLDMMLAEFNRLGYRTVYSILNADDYGVPQKRKRIILIGEKNAPEDFAFPAIERHPYAFTVGDMLAGFPSLANGRAASPYRAIGRRRQALLDTRVADSQFPITQHSARPHTRQDLEIYKRAVQLWNKNKVRLSYEELPEELRTHKNVSSFLDRFKVVAANLPCSHTVVAHIARDGHYYIHPDLNQNRSLSVREAARLQTFPDNYYFEGMKEGQFRTAAFRQIGNAVPVLLAYRIAESLKENWHE